MPRSSHRVLTTHTGSLPRPKELRELLLAHETGQDTDSAHFQRQLQAAVRDVVQRQLAAGIDVIGDGEMSKTGFVRYVTDRLGGFAGRSATPQFADVEAFPEFASWRASEPGRAQVNPACEGPVEVRDRSGVERDIENLRSALNGHPAESCFIPAASPGVVAMNLDNHYYPSQEAYVFAVADAMKYEYQAIAAAGFTIQLDCPDLAMGRHRHFKDRSLEDFLAHSSMSIDALNHSVTGIPPGQLRLHVCWGNYEGPHTHDVELRDVLPVVLRANVGAFVIETANPRHEHEWQVFEQIKLPEDVVLIPGVIDSTTNFVEHPRLVAQRIVRFARLVGRERVIAGTDCGFGTAAARGNVAADVVWAKLASLSEGAAIASKELWS